MTIRARKFKRCASLCEEVAGGTNLDEQEEVRVLTPGRLAMALFDVVLLNVD
jgi:hypothetical protein